MATNIASERVRLGLRQADLAEKLGVGISTVLRWERERLSPSASQLVMMAELFGCSTDYLLGLTDERKPKY